MQDFRPATQKQIEYLQKVGYDGNLVGLTVEEASQIIAGYKEIEAREAAEKAQANPSDIFSGNESSDYKPYTPQPKQEPKAQPVAATKNEVAVKNISDKVLNQITSLQEVQGLVLPKGYNPTNALKGAYLKLSENNLLNTDQTALAEALLNMVIQGLNPLKNQCYFINYGGKVNMMRSYFGDRTVAINTGLVKDIDANIIYEGDVVNVSYENSRLKVEHIAKWENYGGNIVGAYAYAVMPDGTTRYDIMKLDRIKKSWQMSKNNTNNKLQTNFTDDACKRTVIRHLVKMIFNETCDSQAVVESYNKTTQDEYVNDDYKQSGINAVANEQKDKNGKRQADIDIKADDLEWALNLNV